MNDREYWQSRAIILQEALLNKPEELHKDLEKQFKLAIQNIEKEISLWYSRFSKNNQISYSDAQRLLNSKELKEFKWSVEDYIRYGQENSITQSWIKQLENASSKAHVTRLECIKLKLQHEIEVLIGSQHNKTKEILSGVYTDGYYKQMYELQKGLGFGFSINYFTDKEIERILSKPWTSDNVTFSDRWGNYRVDLINTLKTELTQNIMLGKKPDSTIELISKKFNKTRNQAGNLVMTESAYFSSLSREDCYNDLGVEEFEVVATLDLKTSVVCRDLDGVHLPLSEYEVGVTAPPFHNYCRTTTCPYFNDEFTLNEKRIARGVDGETYEVPSDMKYNDWYDKFVNKNTNNAYNELAVSVDDDEIGDAIAKSFKDIGVKGKVTIPPKSIDISSYDFDDNHINNERGHNISKEEAISFVENAIMSLERWNGQSISYYSWGGATYIDTKSKIIRTSFNKNQFDEKTRKMMEVLEKYGY